MVFLMERRSRPPAEPYRYATDVEMDAPGEDRHHEGHDEHEDGV